MCGGGGGNIIDVITDPVTVVSAVAAGFLAPGAGFSIAAALLAGGSIAATALLAPSPEVPDLTIGADRVTQGRNVSIRQAIAPWRVIYGTVRVGGIFVNLNTSNSNLYLHATIVMACHEINAFTKLHLDDDVLTIGSSPFTSSGNDSNGVARYEVTSGTFYDSNSKIRAKFHTGTSTQLADADQVSELSEWTTNHRLRGRAYIYVRCEHDDDIFRNGMPSMSVVMQGKKVYDPRTTNTAFSNNPALCIRDFLTDTSFGLKIAASEINDANTVGGFAYAANRCEDTINSANRYSCDGTFDLSQSPKQILDQMLASCAGKLIYQNGKFNIYVGFYTAPTITLTQEDFIEPVQLVTKLGRKDIFNKVSGTFYDSANNFVADEFTPVASSQYKTEDNSEEITADVEFTFTTSEIDTEYFDSDNAFDTSTHRFTPQTAGKYFFYGTFRGGHSDNNCINNSTISLSKNGSTFSYGHSSSDVTSSNVKGAYMSITGAVELNGSTDYVELRLRLNMVSQTPTVYDSYFGGYKIIGA